MLIVMIPLFLPKILLLLLSVTVFLPLITPHQSRLDLFQQPAHPVCLLLLLAVLPLHIRLILLIFDAHLTRSEVVLQLDFKTMWLMAWNH
ncbi:unnamed protein product [Linum trigynum]|uniref:NADH dehydrogenase subunit 4 n=1 Tax=Linum trigynum TaxID=586398 RepID=A0AAV2DY27_9ROSI